MDSRIVKVVREMPSQLKRVWDGMFDESEQALRTGVSALRQSLVKVESYLAEVEREHLSASAAKAPAAAGSRGTPRRRRRGKRFPTGDFVLDQLAKSRTGLRPRDIAQALRTEAPGVHKDATAIVNTTLARLRGQKKVVNRNGVWSAASA